jgi:hypothetical protein
VCDASSYACKGFFASFQVYPFLTKQRSGNKAKMLASYCLVCKWCKHSIVALNGVDCEVTSCNDCNSTVKSTVESLQARSHKTGQTKISEKTDVCLVGGFSVSTM